MMKLWYQPRIVRILLCTLGLGLAASVVFAAPEIEDNNTFGSRQTLPFGTIEVEGELPPFNSTDFDHHFSGNLAAGVVDSFAIPGLTADTPFIAWTNNDVGGPNPDTMLGTFSDFAFPALIDSDDDSSLLGDGVASALGGVVNPDGVIRLGVTGFSDDTFTGAHAEAGPYELFVRLGTASFADIDFFTFRNLEPGSPFIAEITVGNFSPVLGWVADSGGVIATDSGGEDSLAFLFGNVPASGELHFAVTGMGDVDFTGAHLDFGDYTLSLSATTVPAVRSIGDVSGDRTVSAYDAALVLQFSVGLIGEFPIESILDNLPQPVGDVSGDGNVDAHDAALILQYVVGQITGFPADPGD